MTGIPNWARVPETQSASGAGGSSVLKNSVAATCPCPVGLQIEKTSLAKAAQLAGHSIYMSWHLNEVSVVAHVVSVDVVPSNRALAGGTASNRTPQSPLK